MQKLYTLSVNFFNDILPPPQMSMATHNAEKWNPSHLIVWTRFERREGFDLSFYA